MGRQRQFVGVHLFSLTKSTAKCLVFGCDYSYTPRPSAALHSKPLRDHLRRWHTQEYQKLLDDARNGATPRRERRGISGDCSNTRGGDLCAKRRKTEVIMCEMTKEGLQEHLVEAVTVNGLPLSLFEISAISKIVSPIANKLGVALTQRAVLSLTLEAAKKKLLELRREFSTRLVSVKLDLCTCRGRHFLGVNVQAVVGGRLNGVTLAVKEVTERATGAEIRLKLLACLEKLGVEERQIYSLTTDNSSNVASEEKFSQNDMTSRTYPGSEGEQENIEEHLGEDEASHTALDGTIDGVELTGPGVAAVRCALHTLHLCVQDGLQADSDITSLLSKVRRVVKATHTPDMRQIFKSNSVPLPKLDCEVRWGATYNMLQSIIDSMSFFNQISLPDESLLLSEEDWEKICDLTAALKPLYEAIFALQMKNLTAGEFLAEWMKCRVQLATSTAVTSPPFLRAMEDREPSLVNNPAFISAVYLDKRYNVLLTEEQRELSTTHLLELWRKISIMETASTLFASVPLVAPRSEDIVGQLLRICDADRKADVTGQGSQVAEDLEKFTSTPRINRCEDIFQWWHYQQEGAMKRLAEAALALPVTQASVDRTLSGVDYILSHSGLGLDDEVVDAILLLRCNA